MKKEASSRQIVPHSEKVWRKKCFIFVFFNFVFVLDLNFLFLIIKRKLCRKSCKVFSKQCFYAFFLTKPSSQSSSRFMPIYFMSVHGTANGNFIFIFLNIFRAFLQVRTSKMFLFFEAGIFSSHKKAK